MLVQIITLTRYIRVLKKITPGLPDDFQTSRNVQKPHICFFCKFYNPTGNPNYNRSQITSTVRPIHVSWRHRNLKGISKLILLEARGLHSRCNSFLGAKFAYFFCFLKITRELFTPCPPEKTKKIFFKIYFQKTLVELKKIYI